MTGDGVAAKSGGRVVKNVSGYDIHKMMIGSLGTLGVITRVNFRTFPLPRHDVHFPRSFSRLQRGPANSATLWRSPSCARARWNFCGRRLAGASGAEWLAHAGLPLDAERMVAARLLRGRRNGAEARSRANMDALAGARASARSNL